MKSSDDRSYLQVHLWRSTSRKWLNHYFCLLLFTCPEQCVICNNVGRAEQWAHILTFAALPPSDPRSGPSRLADDDQDDYDYTALSPSCFSTLMVMMPWSGFQIESQDFWRAGNLSNAAYDWWTITLIMSLLSCQKLQPCWQWLLRNYHFYC